MARGFFHIVDAHVYIFGDERELPELCRGRKRSIELKLYFLEAFRDSRVLMLRLRVFTALRTPPIKDAIM